jgi:hypothetical protein
MREQALVIAAAAVVDRRQIEAFVDLPIAVVVHAVADFHAVVGAVADSLAAVHWVSVEVFATTDTLFPRAFAVDASRNRSVDQTLNPARSAIIGVGVEVDVGGTFRGGASFPAVRVFAPLATDALGAAHADDPVRGHRVRWARRR